MNNILAIIKKKIEKGEQISPFLFIWWDIESINLEIKLLSYKLLEEYFIDKSSFFRLENKWEFIKIKQIKDFLWKSYQKSRFKFQIFLIENIWNLTIKAANSCLKIFEEPWKWNLIFLTNSSKSGIINTILSRVQVLDLNLNKKWIKSDFFYSLIDDYIKNFNTKIFSYFFVEKLEKEDYINFLQTLIIYIKDNLVLIDLLSELEEDINLIQKNNLLTRYIVDKYLLRMKI